MTWQVELNSETVGLRVKWYNVQMVDTALIASCAAKARQ